MGPRLNPDGAKIRALRIQRGWTQEQLAEIAGVSSRTIQRAETAGCAAFETLRAVAAAFETDFGQLLVSESREVDHTEPQQLPQTPTEVGPSAQRGEALSPARTALSIRRTWTTPQVAAAALVAAVLTGGILTYRLYPPALHSSEPQQNPASAAKTRAGQGIRHPETAILRAPAVPQAVAGRATATRRKSGPEVKEPESQYLSVPTAGTYPLAGLASPTTIPSPPQPTSLDLPLQSREPLEFPDIHMPPGGWDTLSMAPGADLSQDDPDTGVVRQALGQAAKKTGGCFAKVGASMRWAF